MKSVSPTSEMKSVLVTDRVGGDVANEWTLDTSFFPSIGEQM
jgi:hypothetical protein